MEPQKKEDVFGVKGLVLKSVNYGDAHRIFTFFTPRDGLLSIMAYGVRKIKSKLRGAIEPLNLLELQLKKQPKTGFLTVREHHLEKSYAQNMDYSLLWELFPFLRFLTGLHFSGEEENQKVYDMVLKFFEIISGLAKVETLKLLEYTLVLKILITLALSGNFRRCSTCGKEWGQRDEDGFLDLEAHLFLCRECSRPGVENFTLEAGFHQFLQKLIYSRFDEVINLKVTNKNLRLLRELIDIIVGESLGKRWSDFEIQENPFDYQSSFRLKEGQKGPREN